MKFGIVVFPGTNAAEGINYILEEVMHQQVQQLWHKTADLSSFTENDCIIIPTGSAYGNYLRPGALAKVSPIMEKLQAFARSGGYVLGIGNGFQILCESGLLPGVLLPNHKGRFIGKNVFLKTITSYSPITAAISPDTVLRLPIAHSAGRYYTDSTTLAEMKANDQILFRYCNEAGQVNPQHNPDGSFDNIAGIINQNRNVFGLMALPERAVESLVGNVDGRQLFESLIRTAKTDIINH